MAQILKLTAWELMALEVSLEKNIAIHGKDKTALLDKLAKARVHQAVHGDHSQV